MGGLQRQRVGHRATRAGHGAFPDVVSDQWTHPAGAAEEPIPALEFDQTWGVVNLHCASGICGGAWVGVVQALAGCGESCGLPMPAYRSCAVSKYHAGQSFPEMSKCSL